MNTMAVPNYFRFAFGVYVFVLLTGFALCTQAQEPLSEHEKIMLAIPKLTESEPNYSLVIESMDEYKSQSSGIVRKKIYEREYERLKGLYPDYDVESDYIKIATMAKAYLTLDFKIPMLEFRYTDEKVMPVPYFSYPYQNDEIDVFVSDLQNFKYLPLNQKEYDRLKNILSVKKQYEVELDMEVQPVFASAKTTEGSYAKHWSLSTRTASLQFTYEPEDGGEPVTLGTYVAPWAKKE